MPVFADVVEKVISNLPSCAGGLRISTGVIKEFQDNAVKKIESGRYYVKFGNFTVPKTPDN